MHFILATAAAAQEPINKADAIADQLGFFHMLSTFTSGENIVGLIVFIILVVMSIVAWYYTVVKSIRNRQIRSNADRIISTFWETKNAQESIRFLEEQDPNEPFSKIALDCAQAAAHHQRNEGSRLAESLSRSEFIDRALRQAVSRESARLEDGQTWLASTGATAPFVGLLGTVWGIYNALLGIGASGEASIAAVAGPVGEALIMTALGLFVAIPAVLAFNAFNRTNRKTNAMFDSFAHDLHDFFATGARVGGTGKN